LPCTFDGWVPILDYYYFYLQDFSSITSSMRLEDPCITKELGFKKKTQKTLRKLMFCNRIPMLLGGSLLFIKKPPISVAQS
jgi:hypothetical protein